jgi:hypothetical protein
MKKKDIWISLAIIACSIGVVYHYTQGKGYIEVDTGGIDATLQLRSSLFGHATIRSDAEPAEVRAIIHKPRHIRITTRYEGHYYQIDSDGPWGSLSKINVENNKTTSLRFGPPFVIKPDIHNNRNQISIDFAILGQAGEQYRKYALKNNRMISGAKLKIIDEEGNVLENGKFQYG